MAQAVARLKTPKARVATRISGRRPIRSAIAATVALVATQFPAAGQTLPAPGFHHLHINSTDPAAAIAYFAKEFPSTAAATWAGSMLKVTGSTSTKTGVAPT